MPKKSRYAEFVPEGVSAEVFETIVSMCGDGPAYVRDEITGMADRFHITNQEASWIDLLGWAPVAGFARVNDLLLAEGTNTQKVQDLREKVGV